MKQKLRVLNLEDNPHDSELIQAALSEEWPDIDLIRVETREDFVSSVEQRNFNVILGDYALPDFDGITALAVSKEICPDTPYVFVSGVIGEELAIEILKKGAADYVLKNHLAKLVPAVKRALQEAEEIARRKKAEEAIKESEEKFRTIYTDVRDGIVLIDAEIGFIADCNPAFESQAGRRLEELKGMKIWEIRPPEMTDAAKKKFYEILAAGAGGTSDLPIQQAGGVIIDVEFHAKRLTVGGKEYILGVSKDITERKKAEARLKEYSEHLEDMVRARTKELEDANVELEVINKELAQRKKEADDAKRQADAANKAKSEFLANMSHELRTPLNSIIGFSEVLSDKLFGELNHKQTEYVKNIYESGKHLLKLINDILDLSKVESGRIELEASRFPVKEAMFAAMTMLKEKAIRHGVDMCLDVEPDADIEIEADERKLKQIMFNLLSNAVKFTNDGGSVRVSARRVKSSAFGVGSPERERIYSELRTHYSELNKDFIEISVSDTGIGIKEEDMPKLFKEFSQIESAYTKSHEGTGLGLVLTKKMIELHGGRIWAESEFGKGSSFCFVIPVERGLQ